MNIKNIWVFKIWCGQQKESGIVGKERRAIWHEEAWGGEKGSSKWAEDVSWMAGAQEQEGSSKLYHECSWCLRLENLKVKTMWKTNIDLNFNTDSYSSILVLFSIIRSTVNLFKQYLIKIYLGDLLISWLCSKSQYIDDWKVYLWLSTLRKLRPFLPMTQISGILSL